MLNQNPQTPCYGARIRLGELKKPVVLAAAPSRAPRSYFPRKRLRQFFLTSGANQTLRMIFTCTCDNCRSDYGLAVGELDLRGQIFDAERQSLQGKYLGIYALLIYIGRPGLIHEFMRQELTLEHSFLSHEQLRFLRNLYHLEGINIFSVIKSILQAQYQFLVRPINSQTHVSLRKDREVLPVTEETGRIGDGHFGKVYRLRIHEGYIGPSLAAAGAVFVRKVFTSEKPQVRLKEWSDNIQVNTLRHDHLMPTLGAFEYGDQFFLLFEEAEMNLDQYFNSDGSLFTPHELWEQVYGVAKGLATLHGNSESGNRTNSYVCYHKDLKPSNILIVKKVMKIADFGLMDVKETISTDSSEWSSNAYRAPSSPHDGFNADCDLWSFGAILSEIATFDLLKTDGIKRYQSKRKQDFEPGASTGTPLGFHRDGSMKSSVREHHQALMERVGISDQKEHREPLGPFRTFFYTRRLFSLIEKMLREGREPPGKRFTAVEVGDALQDCHEEARLREVKSQAQGHSIVQKSDIWQMTSSGQLEGDPGDERCRICAHLKGSVLTQCGLLISAGEEDKRIQYCWQDDIQRPSLVIHHHLFKFNRTAGEFLIPAYPGADSASVDPALTLVGLDETPLTISFQSQRDALKFQAAATNWYPYNLSTYSVRTLSYIESRVFRRDKTHRSADCQVQIWSNRPLQESDALGRYNRAQNPTILIAAIESTRVFLIQAKHIAFRQQGGFILRSRTKPIEVYELSIPNGIPTSIASVFSSPNISQAVGFSRVKRTCSKVEITFNDPYARASFTMDILDSQHLASVVQTVDSPNKRVDASTAHGADVSASSEDAPPASSTDESPAPSTEISPDISAQISLQDEDPSATVEADVFTHREDVSSWNEDVIAHSGDAHTQSASLYVPSVDVYPSGVDSSTQGVALGELRKESRETRSPHFSRPNPPDLLDPRWDGIRDKLVRAKLNMATLLSHVGVVDPPVAPGFCRIRLNLGYGRQVYDDYVEHQPGAVARLVKHLNDVGIDAVAEHPHSRASQSAPPLSASTHGTTGEHAARSSVVQSDDERRASSPGENFDQTTFIRGDAEIDVEQSFFLFCGITKYGSVTGLEEAALNGVTADSQLFQRLSDMIKAKRKGGRLRAWLSFRELSGIHFAKFRAFASDCIDLAHHGGLCNPLERCRCIPPESLVVPEGNEYMYRPITPGMSPPIGPNVFLQLLRNPQKAGAKPVVLNMLPKRLYKDPQTVPTDCVWGISFHEGWNQDKVTLVFGIGFVIPSFVAGVVWSAKYDDLQSGFTIASWWTAVGAILLSILGILF